MSFKLWERAVPYNDSRLASKTKKYNFWEPAIPCNGNLWFPGWEPLGTVSFKVWEPAVPCHGNLWFPRWEPSVPTFRTWKFFAMVTYGSQVGKHEFQPLGTGSCLQW